nr:hypothetical protein Iba_chr06aCG11780 [Ipomoea batatas]
MLSEKNLKMLATQRFSDEQDLLDRSTKKPKGGGSSSAPMDLENNDVQDPVLSEGASDPDQVSLVEETPQTEMPMELANSMMHDAGTEDGGSESDHISQVAETPPMVTPVADPNVQTAEPVVGNLPPTNAPPGEQLQGDAPVPHQVDRVAQQPRSYLATVVGSGTAPRQDPDEVDNAGNENEQDRSDQQTAGAPKRHEEEEEIKAVDLAMEKGGSSGFLWWEVWIGKLFLQTNLSLLGKGEELFLFNFLRRVLEN